MSEMSQMSPYRASSYRCRKFTTGIGSRRQFLQRLGAGFGNLALAGLLSENFGWLVEELRGGAIFEFRFNYRADYQAETALLLASADGDLFALVGRPTEPAWNDPQEVVPAFVGLDEEEDDDDLDFEMF